jgi:hypothetical protein
MSKLVISDLAFLSELDDQKSNITGAASAGASAAANYNDAVAASGSTTNGFVYARAEGGYQYGGSYYDGSYYYGSSGPRASVDASDRYYYY